MSAVHLKPCPYCGRAARYVAADYVDNSGEPWPFAECDVCNTGAPVEFWNKRAQPADQQGEPVAITELRHIFDSNKGADRTLVISKKLAAQLLADQPATARVVLRAEARECRECNHVGINDESSESACHSCDWSGEHQTEDKCPGCGAENCMAAACPKCGGRYVLIAEAKLNSGQA